MLARQLLHCDPRKSLLSTRSQQLRSCLSRALSRMSLGRRRIWCPYHLRRHASVLFICTGFTQGSLYSSLEDMLTEPELQKKEKWPIRIATKHLVKPGEQRMSDSHDVPARHVLCLVGIACSTACTATSALLNAPKLVTCLIDGSVAYVSAAAVVPSVQVSDQLHLSSC